MRKVNLESLPNKCISEARVDDIPNDTQKWRFSDEDIQHDYNYQPPKDR